ncbi:MAG: MoaD/ThiS family protein [Gemmatimonadota bacterium]|nr:MoaD/ThiS family protein [Gemmatimonadota bacterium]
MATLYLPPQMRDLTGGDEAIEVPAGTLREVVARVDRRFPGFAARVISEGGVMPGLAFSIDHSITSLGLHARVSEESVVHIVPGVAGG